MDHFETLLFFFFFSHSNNHSASQQAWPLWILFAVFPYTSYWSLGLRKVFITNECLMSALKSYLSGLNFLFAVIWKQLHAEKGPVERYLGTERCSCTSRLLLVTAFSFYWSAVHLAEVSLVRRWDWWFCLTFSIAGLLLVQESAGWGWAAGTGQLKEIPSSAGPEQDNVATVQRRYWGRKAHGESKASSTCLASEIRSKGEGRFGCRHFCNFALTTFICSGSWCMNLGCPSHLLFI